MPRFFVGTDQISDKNIVITGTDVNHIRNVLRMVPGEEVTVSDGQGMDYFCKIAELTKEEVRLDIIDSWHSFVELPAKIYLFQGLPKADKMELIIQKCVELGVERIVAVSTERAIVKLDKKEGKKLERWQKIAASAAEQSGRGRIPQVLTVRSFRDAVLRAAESDLALFPYENERTMSLRTAIGAAEFRTASIMTGPEGGFSEDEVSMAAEAGMKICSLGPRILRCETAPLCALSAVMYAAGALD